VGRRLTITLLQIIAESVLKEFLKQLNIWKHYGEKVDCLKRPVRLGTVLMKDEELA